MISGNIPFWEAFVMFQFQKRKHVLIFNQVQENFLALKINFDVKSEQH